MQSPCKVLTSAKALEIIQVVIQAYKTDTLCHGEERQLFLSGTSMPWHDSKKPQRFLYYISSQRNHVLYVNRRSGCHTNSMERPRLKARTWDYLRTYVRAYVLHNTKWVTKTCHCGFYSEIIFGISTEKSLGFGPYRINWCVLKTVRIPLTPVSAPIVNHSREKRNQ